MPKGYWIASLDVTDVDTYKQYVEANAEAFAKYEAKFLTRGGPYTQLEGKNRSRNCILEFKDVETALACYRSREYQKALAVRRHVALADIIIMAGYDGPQPPEQPGELANVSHRPLKIESLPQPQGTLIGDGVALTSMEHPPGLIDTFADAVRSGKLRINPNLPDWARRDLDPICGVALTEAQIDDELTAACQS